EVDNSSAWYRELQNPSELDESAILDQLRQALETNNLAEAQQLFRSNPELCRRAAMQAAFLNEQESDSLLHFIGDEMERIYEDKTFTAMLAPFFTEERLTVTAVRDIVNRGAQLYQSGKFPESLASYAEAAKLAAGTNSLFDKVWIDL